MSERYYQLWVPDGRFFWRVVDLDLQVISDRLILLQTTNELLSQVVCSWETVTMVTTIIIIIITGVVTWYQTEPDSSRSEVLWYELISELAVVS